MTLKPWLTFTSATWPGRGAYSQPGRNRRSFTCTAARSPSRSSCPTSGATSIKLPCSRRALRRLGTEYIDLYQPHGFDPLTPMNETLRALDDLVRNGKVRYLGASNLAAW